MGNYLDAIRECTEDLRNVENRIIASSLSDRIRDTLYKRINLYELESEAYDAGQNKYTVRTTDVHSAMGVLVGRLTLLDDWNEEAYNIYERMDKETKKPYERLFYFVMENCNKDLMAALEESCDFIKGHAENYFDSEEFIMSLLNWLNFGISMLVCIVLVPYLYRAQQNIVKIIVLFFNIDKAAIEAKIEDYMKVRAEIVTHFSKIRRSFLQTNFVVEKISASKHEGKEEAKQSSQEAGAVGTEDALDEDTALNKEADTMESMHMKENQMKIERILSER